VMPTQNRLTKAVSLGPALSRMVSV
jgi:hypothetical protein